MASYDAWGGSWGSSWLLHWTGEHGGTPPTPTPDIPPTSGGVGGTGVRRTRGHGNFGEAWRKHFEQQQARLARLSGELPRKQDRKEAKKAVETIAKVIAELPDDYYSARLNEALGLAAEATTPRKIVRLSRAAAVAAENALIDMLAEALEEPPRYEMTDDDIVAILLLS